MCRLHLVLLCLLAAHESVGETSFFAKPGNMINVGRGSKLSIYCVGQGSPTIVLESGFGGGTAATWGQLQPLLGSLTRTCSYDRAGYGFSSLGRNLPRDLNRAVADLATLLRRSGEKPPYVLAGHSNGGLMIGAYSDRYPEHVAGLVFFDAAVVLPEDVRLPAESADGDPSLKRRLEGIARCLARAKAGITPSKGDECVNPEWYAGLPAELAATEISNRAKPDYWRAYLSEAQHNYSSKLSAQARALLPHKWTHLPVRVFIASVSAMNDQLAARSFGLDVHDKASLTAARAARARGEGRQESLCNFVRNCRAIKVPTANHLVHNEALPLVVEVLTELVVNTRPGKSA